MADPSELFTVPEVAKLLKLSVTFVWREVRAGTLPTIRLGRSVICWSSPLAPRRIRRSCSLVTRAP